jgi:hypothetical protein
MRYIKRYNESNSEGLDEQEIKDFCEMNLAYLMEAISFYIKNKKLT